MNVQIGKDGNNKSVSWYDWSSLANSDISNPYTQTVTNLILFSRHLKDIPEMKNMKTVATHMEAVAECIPTKPRAKWRVPWKSIAFREKWDNM